MKSKTWPKVVKATANGKPCYKVDARHDGGGGRKFFPTKSLAEGFAQQCRVRRQNEGQAGFDDEQLAAYGWTVAQAIRFALDHLERKAASVPLEDAVKALLDFKAPSVTHVRMEGIRARLNPFLEHFTGRTIAEITPTEIKNFLDLTQHPTTRNDRRKEIVMLWRFAKSHKWVAEDLDSRLVPRSKEPAKSRAILTVEQTTRLMAASLDPEVRALNALVLFGGLRVEEVLKLDWSHIDFAQGHVNITAEVSKVDRERFSPMPPNLVEWLAPISKPAGPIVTRTLDKPFRDTWKRAGLYPWTPDAHRHSFVSHRRHLVGDVQTALEAGTSETIIKRHYKRPVKKDAAERYFQIRPNAGGNIIPMPATA